MGIEPLLTELRHVWLWTVSRKTSRHGPSHCTLTTEVSDWLLTSKYLIRPLPQSLQYLFTTSSFQGNHLPFYPLSYSSGTYVFRQQFSGSHVQRPRSSAGLQAKVQRRRRRMECQPDRQLNTLLWLLLPTSSFHCSARPAYLALALSCLSTAHNESLSYVNFWGPNDLWTFTCAAFLLELY